MPQLKMNKNKTLTLVGKDHIFEQKSVVQMQNIMLKLDYTPEALFDCLVNMEESGDNVCELGMCGGFIFSYKQEVL